MRHVERSALVNHSVEEMFDLVSDVAAYPQFLPWCSDAEVLERSDDEMRARLEVSGAGMRRSFITRNGLYRPHRMTLSLVDGPFSELRGEWQFTPLGEAGSRVSLDLTFEVNGRLMDLALSRLFDAAAEKMVDAFCDRADNCFG